MIIAPEKPLWRAIYSRQKNDPMLCPITKYGTPGAIAFAREVSSAMSFKTYSCPFSGKWPQSPHAVPP